jgi:hypothetical protein
VLTRFQSQIKENKVVIHRDYSDVVAKTFPDQYFDWVYIDANHTYEAVYADLHAYFPKIKDDGFIIGHDFTNHRVAQSCHFGVVEAVAQFCKETGTHLLALTGTEEFSTYIIAKNPLSIPIQIFLNTAIYYVPGVVEVRNFFDRPYIHRSIRFTDGKTKHIMSI